MHKTLLEGLSDEQYRAVADKLLTHVYAEHARVAAAQADLAKWMIGSLLVVNGGGMIALGNFKDAPRSLSLEAGPFFTAGIVLAALCGLQSWQNAAGSKRLLFAMADPNLLYDRGRWPKPDPTSGARIARASAWALRFGAASLASFTLACLLGGVALWSAPQPRANEVRLVLEPTTPVSGVPPTSFVARVPSPKASP